MFASPISKVSHHQLKLEKEENWYMNYWLNHWKIVWEKALSQLGQALRLRVLTL